MHAQGRSWPGMKLAVLLSVRKSAYMQAPVVRRNYCKA